MPRLRRKRDTAQNLFAERFGELIKNARTRLDLTQAELGERLGIDRNYLRRIEAGTANPTLDILLTAADVLKWELLIEETVGSKRKLMY